MTNAISGWNATLHSRVGRLFSCSAFLLLCSVAFQPEMALVMHLVCINQRASGDQLRAAIDVGRKQYRPKQLKSFSLFSLDFKPKVQVVIIFLW